MASKLLNVLNDIENGRKECVDVLKAKSYSNDDNMSFKMISEYLKELPDNKNMIITKDIEKDPSIDPDVWHRPSEWPDIANILRNAEDEGTNIACIIFLIDNTYPSTMFKWGTPTSTDTSTLGFGNKTAFVKTSDGVNYSISSANDNVEHTWDVSKDINNKYRWIMVYYECPDTTYRIFTSSSACMYMFRLNSVEIVCNQILTLPNKNYVSYSSASICGYNLQSVQLISPTTPRSIEAFKTAAKTNNSNFATIIATTTNTNDPLKSIVIEKPPIDTRYFMPSDNGQQFRNLNYYSSLSMLADYNCLSTNGTNALTYFKGVSSQFPADSTTSTSRTNKRRLKYVYLLDNPTYLKQGMFDGSPNITVLEGIDNVRELRQKSFGASLNNVKTLALNNVGDIVNQSVFEGCMIDNLILGNTKLISAFLGSFYQLKYLSMPNLETSTTSLGNFYSLIELHLPSLKSLTSSSLLSDIRYTLSYIDVSSLESLSSPTTFNFVGLRYLKLKDDFKFNLTLSSCYSLSKECVLDIFNKCATLEEGESYTITLENYVYNSLTPEEIAIATNKGWTVTI